MKIPPCPVCGEQSCGDDDHVITTYQGPERRSSDCYKVILRQIYDLLEHGYQMREIAAAIIDLMNSHIVEIDGNSGRKTKLMVEEVVQTRKTKRSK